MANMLMPLQIERQYGASLDADYSFGTLEELKNYATTSALSYPGQILYCEGTDTVYKVNKDKTDVTVFGGDNVTTYTSLSQLKLTAPVSVGEIFNAMPNNSMAVIACEDTTEHITDVPTHYGVLTIKKNEIGRFSIDYQISLASSPCNVKRWIGTLKGNDGTGLYWKQLSAEPTFVALSDIGLTADATFQDVVDALPKGASALLGVKEFTNYQTIFPYDVGNDQFARVHIVKGIEDGSSVYARWFRKDGTKEAIASFNINNNKFDGWRTLKNQQVYTSIKELGLDTTATINDILGAMKDGTTFTYKTDVFDYANEYNNVQNATVSINKQSAHRVQALMTDKDTGSLYVGKMDGNAHIVGWQRMISENSWTDPYSCAGYKRLTGTEDLFTLGTGHYVTEKANTAYNYPITDTSNLTAHIYVLGALNDPTNNKGYRIILYFDNKGRMYRINEWWGVFTDNGWQEIITKDYVDSKTGGIDVAQTDITINTNWATQEARADCPTNKYVVKNGICYLSATFTTLTNKNYTSVVADLATGLPKPAIGCFANVTSGSNKNALVYIHNDGVLKGSSLSTNTLYDVSLTYPVTE